MTSTKKEIPHRDRTAKEQIRSVIQCAIYSLANLPQMCALCEKDRFR